MMWSLRFEAIAGFVLAAIMLWGAHWVIAWVLPFVLQYGVGAMAGVVMAVFALGMLVGTKA